MARFADPGESTYTPQVMPEDLPRKINPQMRPSPIGQAVEQFGSTLDLKYKADSATWAGDQVASFRVQAVKSLEDMKAAAPAGDPGDFTSKYLAQFDKSAGTLADTAGGNPYARSMVEKGLTDLRNTLATHTMEWEASQRVASQNASLQQNLDAQLPLVRAHPELADQVGSTLMDQVNATRNDPATKARFGRVMDTQLTQSAALGLVDQNADEVYRQLKSGAPTDPRLQRLTDPTARQQVLEAAQGGVVKQHVQSIQSVYENAGTSAGVQALAALDKDDSIPAELRDPIRDKVNQQLNAWRDQRREQFAPQIAQLETAISGDSAGQPERASAWGLYEKGAFNTTQLASALGGIERAQRENAKKGLSLEAARQAYESGAPLDPQAKDARHGVGLLFTDLTANVPPGSPEYVNRATDVTSKVGVAPDPAISWARSSLVGGDAQSAAQAADLVSRLDGANPRAVPYALDPKTKAIAGTINQAVTAGTDPATAVTMARQNASLGDADVKTLNDRWKQAKADASQPNALQSRLSADERFKPGYFTSLPQVPLAMQADFDALTKDYYRYTGGNVQQARDLAVRDLTHVWGVSQVNGKRELMPYAPEAMFPGLTVEAIRNDIADTVKKEGALAGRDASTVQLVADPSRTARTQGSQWNLAAPDENGLRQVLRDDHGNPLVYRLPVTHEDYGAVRERLNQQALEKAEQLRTEREAEGAREAARDAAHVSGF